MIVLLFAGCAPSPDRAALNRVTMLLDEGKAQTALDAIEGYLQQHPDSAPFLRMRVVVLLRKERPDLAALALQQVPAGRPIIPEILRHRDRIVRQNAARLISEQPNASDLREIIRALDDSDPWVRGYCARALGQINNPAALKPLFRLLTDDNWFVRAETTKAIGKIGDARAVGWLVQLLNDPDGNVRFSAARALHDLAVESARSSLLRVLETAVPPQKYVIAAALARLHDPAALDPLATAAENKDIEVRRLAVQALGECGLAAGTNALLVLLKDPDPVVREQAQAAIRQITEGKSQ
jgi:HEAT repeat protein